VEILRGSGPEVAAKLVEETIDGGEWRNRAGRGGASRGGRGAALLNRGEGGPAGSAKCSYGVSPGNLGAATSNVVRSSSGGVRRESWKTK
jgi:hypothetical protein